MVASCSPAADASMSDDLVSSYSFTLQIVFFFFLMSRIKKHLVKTKSCPSKLVRFVASISHQFPNHNPPQSVWGANSDHSTCRVEKSEPSEEEFGKMCWPNILTGSVGLHMSCQEKGPEKEEMTKTRGREGAEQYYRTHLRRRWLVA